MKTQVSTDILSSTPTKEQIRAWDALDPEEQAELMDKAIQESLNNEDGSLEGDEAEEIIKNRVLHRLNNK
jgi:hypothetical protein